MAPPPWRASSLPTWSPGAVQSSVRLRFFRRTADSWPGGTFSCGYSGQVRPGVCFWCTDPASWSGSWRTPQSSAAWATRWRMAWRAMLSTLTRRLAGGSFPHEVGLFLGYPPRGCGGLPHPPGQKLQAVRLLEGVLRRGAGPPVLPPVRPVSGRPMPPHPERHSPGPGIPGGVISNVTAAPAALTDTYSHIPTILFGGYAV